MRCCLPLVLCAGLAAQGGPIFVVDAAGGAGANYTDLPTAVAAVPDGSTLIVRPGNYAETTIDGKGLTLLGEPTFTIDGVTGTSMTVRNTQPQQKVLLSGFASGGGYGLLVVQNAAGPVTIDGTDSLANLIPGVSAFVIMGSSQVTIRNCRVDGSFLANGVVITSSNVVFEKCTLRGGRGFATQGGLPAFPALAALQSTVQLVQCTVLGGNGAQAKSYVVPAAPAVHMQATSLRAMGTVVHQLLGGVTPGSSAVAAIAGSGVARVEPQLPFSGTVAAVSLTRPEMPSLLTDSALPGGFLTASRIGPAGVLAAMTLSLRAPSTALPGLPDPVWIDPTNFFVEAAAITSPGALFVVQKPVPNVALLRGFEVVWQAFDLDATGIAAASNASPSFVR
jgi:hypothetical protein